MDRLCVDKHEIIVGDCLEYLNEMPDGCIDVVVTSPPYNIGVAYRSYDDRKPRDVYLQFMHEVGKSLSRVLKSDGSLFLNMGSTNRDPWIAHDVSSLFRSMFILQNHIIWIKTVSIGDDSLGHFKPISSRRYLNQNHETIFHFTLSGDVQIDRLAIGVPFKDKSNIARRGHAHDRRCAGNCWFVPYQTVKSKVQKFDHPAGFPTELAARCIKMHGVSDGLVPLTVLDPFMGAGSTLVATAQLDHRGIGIDIDRYYAESAVTRLQSFLNTPSE